MQKHFREKETERELKKENTKKKYNIKCNTKPSKFWKVIFCDNNNRVIKKIEFLDTGTNFMKHQTFRTKIFLEKVAKKLKTMANIIPIMCNYPKNRDMRDTNS